MYRSRSEVLRTLRYFNENTFCAAHGSSCGWHKASHCKVGSSAKTTKDYAFEFKSSNLRFGGGVTKEVGMDLKNMGCKKICVITDERMAKLRPVLTTVEALHKEGLEFDVYDQVRVEPTDKSLKHCIEFVRKKAYDGIVAVGGGSVMDTAKAGNLYSSHPENNFEDFINVPIGKGMVPTKKMKPLIAIPTTSGTGSETTGVIIFDIEEKNFKTGIGHRYLTPTLGLIDSDHVMYQPPGVVISSGFDVLCHALESYTAIPFNERSPRPLNPSQRPAYQGANPIADIWCGVALPIIQQYFVRAAQDPEDTQARTQMQYASCFAGMGFGTAGVHLCHGMSYPISGLNHHRKYVFRDYHALGHPIIPHGVSVVLTAPSVFSFTCPSNPLRHQQAAIWLGADPTSFPSTDDSLHPDHVHLVANRLRDRILFFMQTLGIPDGLSECGFSTSDIPTLVEGALPQQRVLGLSPSPVNKDTLAQLFHSSMSFY
ncbi:hypothetical protein RFI_09279 [Reticulomyxa filosa]|uniref:hydroxyacid-oxoacid transhydrogenase n=1 Tax=Reticulomyxa filosa TaxID=46433 RepID=X6NPJ7_RETFI|nr:hypothetical protein RFI_09279 [Reticulomyxa filosa]|eukprot:ETO27853.1 hypothetical protein RFI_09279 [Reticulomyxa filosa]